MTFFSEKSLAKLRSSGLTEDYARKHGVLPITNPDQLPEELRALSWCAAVPGMLFPWRNPRDPEQVAWQYRPDEPVDGSPKYFFAKGHSQKITPIRPAATEEHAVVLVEGTLQALTFARYAPADVAVYGIPGCWGWSAKDPDDGVSYPTTELELVNRRSVRIFLDADARSNRMVYDAGADLCHACKVYGATEVFFGQVPGRGDSGIDDLLGHAEEARRAELVINLLNPETMIKDKPSETKPPGKVRRKTVLGVSDKNGLLRVNDTAMAVSWGDQSLGRFRRLTDTEGWLAYRDGRWDPIGDEVVGADVGRFLAHWSDKYLAISSQAKDAEDQQKLVEMADGLLANAKLSSVLGRAARHDELHLTRPMVDQHPTLWCAANCVIDLETGEARDHDPDLLLTTGSDVPYMPGAPCDGFDQFLAEVLPDADTRDYVLQVFAMAMIGEVRDHVIPTFIGSGRNGKGTLLKIMARVFGSQAVSINAKALLKRKYDAHAEEIAQLAGRRLAVAEETGQTAVWDVARVNEWTGGNTLNGRFMHGNSFNFEPSHTLIMATNHRPSVGQGERAFWARYREVPFNVSFEGREDLGLAKRITDHELPGVLNRLLEALGRYHQAGKLVAPAAVEMATADAKVDADHLARFCAEHLVITNDHSDMIVNSDLFESVLKWWSQSVLGEPPPGSRKFAEQVRQALGFPPDCGNPRKIGKGPGCKLTWTGIRWLDEGSLGGRTEPLPALKQDRVVDHEYRQTSAPVSADLSKSNEIALGNPPPWSADTGGGSADKSADTDDHERVITLGQDSRSVKSAESADNSVFKSENQEQSNNEDQKGGRDTRNGKNGGANRADRQTWQFGRLILESGAAGVWPGQTQGLDTPDRIASGSARGGLLAEHPPADHLGEHVIFDLETRSADDLYTHPEPAEFVRLAGVASLDSEPIIWVGSDRIVDTVRSSQTVIGHNVIHFDVPALSRIDPTIDVLAMTREKRIFDTMIADSVLFPIMNESRPGEVGRAMKHFGLNGSAERHGVPVKTMDLKAYVKKSCGGDFNAIPWETDPDLQDYLVGDVVSTRGVFRRLTEALAGAPESVKNYLWREHRVHAIAATMSSIGFAVDEPLLRERHAAGVARKAELTATLVDRYGIPTTLANGKPCKSPAATKDGKAALERAFASLGVDMATFPRTPTGALSFGGDPMRELAEAYARHSNGEEIGALCSVVADSAGIRTVYGTALAHLHPDGRVHPQVATFQASGRWSVTKPGLTVFGKRGGRVTERAVFRATEGHVLMAIDLSQIDARMVAVHSQDHAYMDLFGVDPETGKPRDAHELVGRMVWGDATYDSDPKRYRDQIKGITHGLPYGMGTPKLAAHAGVLEEVARRVVDIMNERFPRLQGWKDEIREQAGSGAYLDNGFGRLMKPNPDRAYTQGPALVGQGATRDLMMECLLKIDDFDAKYGTEIIKTLRAQVHDEAIFELPEKGAEEYKRVIERCFNFEWAPNPGFRPIKIMAEGSLFGRSWADCYRKE